MAPAPDHATNWLSLRSPTSSGWSSIIGIVVAIVGNVLISFALNTQRYAHIRLRRDKEAAKAQKRQQSYGTDREQDGGQTTNGDTQSHGQNGKHHEPNESQPLLGRTDSGLSGSSSSSSHDESSDGKKKSYLSSPWWWLGITLMTIGECGNFLAYGFAPASIVSPLGVVALISNCLIAPWMLHEKFRKRDALGVLIATGGCVIVVLSASGSNPRLDADEIWRLISTWEFKTYFGITMGLIVVLMWASSRYGDKSILIDLGLVGLFGGYTALSTKGVASLLSNTIWRVVTFPVTYLLVAILVSTAILQIKYVNRALQRFDSTQVIPTQFVMFTISVIVGSAILYRDFERKSAEDAGEFFAGCALTFLGVYCITSGRSRDHATDEESNPSDEAGGIRLAAEDGPQHSRTTSQATRISTTSRPGRTRRTQSDQIREPIVRLIDTDDERANAKHPLDLVINPGAASAIHHPPSELPTGTHTSPERSQRPPMHATTSDPVLLMVGQPDDLGTGNTPRASPRLGATALERPRTPENLSPLLEPGSAHTPRFGSIGRHSISELFPHPGPLTNPLSGSLSAIVADSLRKDYHGGSARRRSLRSKRSRRLDEAFSYTPLLPEEESEEQEHTDESPSKSTLKRFGRTSSIGTPTPGAQSDGESRSFGQAFGAFLSRKKSASRGDEEAA